MRSFTRTPPTPHRRRGLITPIVAVAIVVIMLALALIIDRLWIEAARNELQSAAEAAALGSARVLASDDLLKSAPPAGNSLEEAVTVEATRIAALNRAVGDPVALESSGPLRDVFVGRLAAASSGGAATATDGDNVPGRIRFTPSEADPQSVVVVARRLRQRGNPVGLFVVGLTGLPWADVEARAEASVCGRVVGLQPLDGSTVPLLPIAILGQDPAGGRTDTWANQVESRQGGDAFSVDPITGEVTDGPDGIVEMELLSQATPPPSLPPNVRLVDLGTDLRPEDLERQLENGVTKADLAPWQGRLLLNARIPGAGSGASHAPASDEAVAAPLFAADSIAFESSGSLGSRERDALERIIGQARVALLFEPSAADPSLTNTSATRLVGVRVLRVRDESDGSCRVTVQPTVVVTRAAIATSVLPLEPGEASYVYKLQLTY